MAPWTCPTRPIPRRFAKSVRRFLEMRKRIRCRAGRWPHGLECRAGKRAFAGRNIQFDMSHYGRAYYRRLVHLTTEMDCFETSGSLHLQFSSEWLFDLEMTWWQLLLK